MILCRYSLLSLSLLAQQFWLFTEVLRHNEENLKKQAELKKTASTSKTDKSSRSVKSSSSSRDSPASQICSRKAARNRAEPDAETLSEAVENSDIGSSRPDTPDSVRSEVSGSSVKTSEMSQKQKSSKTPARSQALTSSSFFNQSYDRIFFAF